MSQAIVRSNQIMKYGRMDAAFHIAVSKVEGQVNELAQKISKEDAVNRILKLKTEDLKCLEPLTTGNNKAGRAEFIRAAEAYPLIAYALILENIASLEESAEKDVGDAEAYSESIKRMRM